MIIQNDKNLKLQQMLFRSGVGDALTETRVMQLKIKIRRHDTACQPVNNASIIN